jgi:AraC-like DNA-binding protein
VSRVDLFHFIPGLIGLACYTSIYLKNSAEKDHLLLSPEIIAFSHYEQASAVSLAFVYLLFSVRRINRFKIKENGFVAKRKSLLWLKKLLLAVTVLLGVWSGVLLLDLWLYDFGLSIMTYYPLWLGLALFLFWVGYQCLFHNKEIFNRNGVSSNMVSYGRNLSAAIIQGHVAALTGLMEKEKPHLDPTLNLNKLADRVSMHPKDLTIVLNQELETNFYDFLNEYRIEEAKTKLLDPQYKHLTILAIAYDSGFNSKSSFNALFKKYVKMTPKEFIKKFEN